MAPAWKIATQTQVFVEKRRGVFMVVPKLHINEDADASQDARMGSQAKPESLDFIFPVYPGTEFFGPDGRESHPPLDPSGQRTGQTETPPLDLPLTLPS